MTQTLRPVSILGYLGLTIFALVPGRSAHAQGQRPDPDFDTTVEVPAYTSDGPRVLFDEAHHNFHTATGRYKPFADLIKNDGYAITPNPDPFTAERLAPFKVLVIANAIGSPKEFDPAFTEAECDVVRDWVKGGGSLFLISDHFPMGSAAERLSLRFGVEMSKGMTDEYKIVEGKGFDPSHPIMRGRSAEEAIHRIRTFTGQSLKGPAGSVTLLRLPTTAIELQPDPVDPGDREKAKEGPAKYPDQGVALTFGKGRVVVLGEAGMLSAQISGRGDRFGMNVPGNDNRQFALNVMHWLSGELPEK